MKSIQILTALSLAPYAEALLDLQAQVPEFNVTVSVNSSLAYHAMRRSLSNKGQVAFGIKQKNGL